MNNKFYTQYKEKYESVLDKCALLPEEPIAEEYDHAVVLPLRKVKNIKVTGLGPLEGGVCDDKYNFIAGSQRWYPNPEPLIHKRTCLSAYIPEKKPIYRDETVIFGGVINAHFGHMLVDSMSRMWYRARNPECNYKYIFLLVPSDDNYTKDFFELSGLSDDKYEIITFPTQFKKIIVPSETMFALSGHASKAFLEYFDLLKENVEKVSTPSKHKKIYLTRTQLENSGSFNEEYYENFFKSIGYKIISPEKYSLAEQINFIMNAEDIVCTMGTLAHLVLFANNNVNLTILLREPKTIIHAQFAVNLLRGVNCSYVESTNNFLPTSHVYGMIFFSPTEYFYKYLDDNNCKYEVEGINYEQIGRFIYEYANWYKQIKHFKRIANTTSFDFINEISKGLLGESLDSKKYKKWISTSDNITDKLEKKIEKLENELSKIKNSRSYKITAPLRWLGKKLRKIKKFFKK